MKRLGRYQVVAIALHASPRHIHAFLDWLGWKREDLSVQETEWKPMHRAEDGISLPFGRAPRKNVHAHLIVPQLMECGYRFAGVQIERRKDVHTLRDQRRMNGIRAGQPKLDAQGRPVWKESLVLQFDTAPVPTDLTVAPRFSAMLGATIWKRCRVVEQFPFQGKPGIAIVELSGPRLQRPQKNRILTLMHTGAFTCLDVRLPSSPRP
ncbi:MAG TPA: hypothetical protein VMU11_02825 [Verrucomicrobiae bacterium]|nr:hypothetical protein [Verrucomicrobiae bacterium]